MDTNTQQQLAVSELLPIAKQSEAYAATVDGIEVHDDDSFALVGDLKKDLNHYRRKLEDKRLSLVGPLKKVTGDIDAMFKAPRDKIDAVLNACTKKMNGYAQRQEQIAQEARRKQAQEDREREERLRKAAADAVAATHNPDDEIAAVLVKQADSARDDARAAPTAKAGPVRGDRSSVSTTKTWVAEVVDMQAVCRAVGVGRLPIGIIDINQADINGLARALETEGTRDGIRYFQKISTAVR